MKRVTIMLLFWFSTAYPQGHLIENPLRNIPKWVRNEFSAQHLNRKYSILFRLYPHCLRGDFNADGKRDAAVQIEETSTGKLGIAIFHSKKAQALFVPVTVLGAGKPVGRAGDDLKWAEVWSAYRQRSPATGLKAKLPDMEGDAIKLEKRGGPTGLIYWDGKKYGWYRLSR